VICLDWGLGVSKTWRRAAVAGTECRGARKGEICIGVPRMRAGRGAGKGMIVMAATAANESILPRERGLESSRMFILEKRSTSPSTPNVGCRTAVVIGRRSHLGAPKFVTPFFDGKGSYEHDGGYDDGNACKGARGSSGLQRLSAIDIIPSPCSVEECGELGGDAGTFLSSGTINFSIRWYRLSNGSVAPSAIAFFLKT
jgi:hypothetical protein